MRIPDFIRDADADDIAFAGAVSLAVLAFVGLLFLAFGIWGGSQRAVRIVLHRGGVGRDSGLRPVPDEQVLARHVTAHVTGFQTLTLK